MARTIAELAYAFNNNNITYPEFRSEFSRLVADLKSKDGFKNSEEAYLLQAEAFVELYRDILPEKKESFLEKSEVERFLKINQWARSDLKVEKLNEHHDQAMRRVVALEANNELSNNSREFLAGIIRGNPEVSINTASEKYHQLTPEAFSLLLEELPTSEVTTLKIKFDHWGEDSGGNTQAMLEAFAKNKSLKKLDLSGNDITNASARNIGRIISSYHSKNLETLNLSNTTVCSENGATILALELRFSTSLKSLNLSHTAMADQSVFQLATAFVRSNEEQEQDRNERQAQKDTYLEDIKVFEEISLRYKNINPPEKPKSLKGNATPTQKAQYTIEHNAYRKYSEDQKNYNKLVDKYGLDEQGKLMSPGAYHQSLNRTLKELDLSNNKEITDASLPALQQMLDNNKELKISLQATGLTQEAIITLKNNYGDRINPAPVMSVAPKSERATDKEISKSARPTNEEIFSYNPVMQTMKRYLVHGDLGLEGVRQGESRNTFMRNLQSTEYKALPAALKTKMIDQAIKIFKEWHPPSVVNLSDKRLLSQMNNQQFESLLTSDIVFGKKIDNTRSSDFVGVRDETLLDTKNIDNMDREQIYLLFNHINTDENRARLEALPRNKPLGPNDDPKRGVTRWAEVIEAMKDRVFACTLEGTENNPEQKARNLVGLAKDSNAQKLMGTHASGGFHLWRADSYYKLEVSGSELKRGSVAVTYAEERAARAHSNPPKMK